MRFLELVIINLGALLTAIGGIFLKQLSTHFNYTNTFTELIIYVAKSPNTWIGLFCYIGPVFLWAYLLSHMELTKLQPMLSIVYVYTVLLSTIFLNEVPSLNRIFGIALIIIGVIFVGRS